MCNIEKLEMVYIGTRLEVQHATMKSWGLMGLGTKLS